MRYLRRRCLAVPLAVVLGVLGILGGATGGRAAAPDPLLRIVHASSDGTVR